MVRWKTKKERAASSKRLWSKEKKVGTLLRKGSRNIRSNIHYKRKATSLDVGTGKFYFGKARRRKRKPTYRYSTYSGIGS